LKEFQAEVIEKGKRKKVKGKIMKSIPEAFTNISNAWNEKDLTKIRSQVDKSVAENIVFADPSNYIHGIEAFENMVKEFRGKYPESVVKRTSGLDSHNRRYRYSWEIYIGDMMIVKGFDVATLNETGLIERIDGFFGDLPPLES
jgi:hypothetical protein